MNAYQRYLKAMNLNKKSPLSEGKLKAMWDNWLCTDEDEKLSFHSFELTSHWRERQIEVMRELGIEEEIKFRRGGHVDKVLIKFSEDTKHLFATKQNQIIERLEFVERLCY